MLVGDFGQLPPVMDLPLYSSVPRSAIADLGRTTYQLFAKAVVLTEVLRQGQDREQVRFRALIIPSSGYIKSIGKFLTAVSLVLGYYQQDVRESLQMHASKCRSKELLM